MLGIAFDIFCACCQYPPAMNQQYETAENNQHDQKGNF